MPFSPELFTENPGAIKQNRGVALGRALPSFLTVGVLPKAVATQRNAARAANDT